jgi:hypothetical protein
MLWDDDLGCAGSGGRSGGACATVVDDGRDSLEERLLIDLTNCQAVGLVI